MFRQRQGEPFKIKGLVPPPYCPVARCRAGVFLWSERMNEAERKIRQYVQRSAGNCNHITDHTMRCFVGMIETGEALPGDFNAVSPTLGDRVLQHKAKLDAERTAQ